MLSKDQFLKLIRLHYRVIKETLLTTEMAVREGKAIRRLDVDEVIAVHEGPHKDPVLGITRLRGCTIKDSTNGWATTTGNTGGVFLEECGDSFELVKLCLMGTEFEPESPLIRDLKVGEKIEVLEWDKKHEPSGRIRLKVKVVADGAVGWITKMVSDDEPVLKPSKL
mmetsp:Transcript_12255/g.28082  ORF Transcript_12255/g.28082 Transcript_12255/m.28082 type:complete len:167 (-) Transcript_12255:76-576(-)